MHTAFMVRSINQFSFALLDSPHIVYWLKLVCVSMAYIYTLFSFFFFSFQSNIQFNFVFFHVVCATIEPRSGGRGFT